jgi:hypothetical protein
MSSGLRKSVAADQHIGDAKIWSQSGKITGPVKFRTCQARFSVMVSEQTDELITVSSAGDGDM